MKIKFIFSIFTFSVMMNLAYAQDADLDLLQACYNQDELKVIQALKDSANINCSSNEGMSPLMYVASNGNLDIAKILIHNGANIDAHNYQYSVMGFAVEQNHEDMVDLLCRSGADLNFQNYWKAGALHLASFYGYYIIVDMLTFYGAKIDIKDVDSNTPLMYACYYGRTDIVDLLLQKGANPNEVDENGMTSLMIASQNGFLDIVEILVKNGANIYAKDFDDHNALMFAIANKMSDVSYFLVANDSIGLFKNNKDYADLALLNKDLKILKLMHKNNFEFSLKPLFYQYGIQFNHLISGKDFQYQINTGISDLKYNFGFLLGFQTRYQRKPVLVETDDYFLQVYEKRYNFSLGIHKDFNFYIKENDCYGAFVQFEEYFTYGRYEGFETKMDKKLLPSFSSGLYWQNPNIGMRLFYKYLDYGIYDVSPHYAGLGLNLNLTKQKSKIEQKKIRWIDLYYLSSMSQQLF